MADEAAEEEAAQEETEPEEGEVVAEEEAAPEEEEVAAEEEPAAEEESPAAEEEAAVEEEAAPLENGNNHAAENGSSGEKSDIEEEVEDIKMRLDRLESDQGALQDNVNDLKTKFEDGRVTSPTKKSPGSSDIVGPSIPMSNLRAMFGN